MQSMSQHSRSTYPGKKIGDEMIANLNDSEKKELVFAYIDRYSQLISLSTDNVFKKEDKNFLAYEKFNEIIFTSPDEGFEIIKSILAKTENDDVLDNLAAGPLEDLVRFHGNKFIDKIELQAKNDEKFKSLLGGLWQVGEADVWGRIEKILD